jgi:hypothetical protein
LRAHPGSPYPLGATWDGEGVNFALFAEHATRVELCLFDAADDAEEEIFYPALRAVSALVKEAETEHEEVARLIGDVERRDPAGAEFQRMSRELQAKVEHDVAEEEGPMFRDAQRLGDAELERLGRRLEERQRELKSSTLQRGLRAAKLAAKKAM